MSSEEHQEQIVQQIAGCQDRLFAYILTLVPRRDVARDILQEANLVLWRRREEFVPGCRACRSARMIGSRDNGKRQKSPNSRSFSLLDEQQQEGLQP